jgi:hypothetical protein
LHFVLCAFGFVLQVRDSFAPLLGASLGNEVESALFALQAGVGALYKSQWRDIIANLRDITNDLKSGIQAHKHGKQLH